MIGIYCTHSYNHTSYDADERLPDCLRGVDAAIFSTFRALSFHVEARPVLKLEKRIYANIADEERFTFEHWARTTVIAGTWFVPGGEAKINLNIGGWYWVSPLTLCHLKCLLIVITRILDKLGLTTYMRTWYG